MEGSVREQLEEGLRKVEQMITEAEDCLQPDVNIERAGTRLLKAHMAVNHLSELIKKLDA